MVQSPATNLYVMITYHNLKHILFVIGVILFKYVDYGVPTAVGRNTD